MNTHFQPLRKDTYSEYIKNNDCLIIFFKERCPNCKVLMKVMEKCSAAHPDMLMAEVDSEESGDLLDELDISRVPTILVYKKGAISARRAGVMKPAELAALYHEAG